ncbi:hypothetical protein [Perlucidibaca piscinae]|uniref:hypothetical protein n=1 Tax=Perlucidibaca piscinae TaxID=392589 RepID=UPI0004150B93|nr:hypothetical protein [Perlucidibaca piscinae]
MVHEGGDFGVIMRAAGAFLALKVLGTSFALSDAVCDAVPSLAALAPNLVTL